MSMASRPGFLRKDTERHGSVDVTQTDVDPVASGSKTYELGNVDSKHGGFVDIDEGTTETPPDYENDAGDGFAKVTGPVETAKDLVTQVIHVDDDPSLSPYTFRLFFLGNSAPLGRPVGVLTSRQEVVCPSSVPSCKRSSTSSHRPFTSQSSS